MPQGQVRTDVRCKRADVRSYFWFMVRGGMIQGLCGEEI
jgi:hypothetical protein